MIGELLTAKRARQGLTVKEAAAKAGIKHKEAEALEKEDMLQFKSRGKGLAAIKAYAAFLKLDEAEITGLFNRAWTGSSAAKAFIYRQHRRKFYFSLDPYRRLLSYGSAVVATSLLLILGGYYYFNLPAGDWFSVTENEITAVAKSEQEKKNNQAEIIAGNETDVSSQTGLLEGNNETPLSAATADLIETEDAPPAKEKEIGENNLPASSSGSNTEAITNLSGNNEIPVPRADGASFLAWIGVVTITAGIALFFGPAAMPAAAMPGQVCLYNHFQCYVVDPSFCERCKRRKSISAN